MIHASIYGRFLKLSLGVGRAAANEGELICGDVRALLVEAENLANCCRSIHPRHTVVHQDEFVELASALYEFFDAILYLVYRDLSLQGLVALD